ncbi:hypothetical protein KBP46_18390 [Chryseobacterium sp. PCH239]|uniref:PIN-like domain-containing protein n=1 Tax=Chryseobacterium sp. PCH239 TaxID=2825845 RepID=UPI001C0F7099|nr:PIN-like domain-containing protein [Chryseobacterium sp. PCH239]QWT85402.1 hypothetical protein KBP46_18390 [Chryseobacterium sp. PCH239]
MNKKPFYQIEEEQEKELFENSIIFFDTSSILDMYYFTEENLLELKDKLFDLLKGRLLLTYQTEFEFLKNREKVKLKPIDSYNNLIKKINGNNDSGHVEKIQDIIKLIETNFNNELKGQFKTLQEKVSINNKHPSLKDVNFSDFEIQVKSFEEQIDNFKTNFDLFKKDIIEKIELQKEIIANSDVDRITPLLEEYFNIMQEPTLDEINSYILEGEFRYNNDIPPGYLDKNEKVGFQKYGDLIIWKEILRHAKQLNKDIILVVNDVKEDWWYYDNKKAKVSPRYELLKEFKDFTNNKFWMYEMKDFLYKANKYIPTSITPETIKDIVAISEMNSINSVTHQNILITANRQDEEPSRIDRLERVALFYSKNISEINIYSLHDHKGILTVSWSKEPSNIEKKTIALAWMNENELEGHIEHVILE